jgi:hypothetical protein
MMSPPLVRLGWDLNGQVSLNTTLAAEATSEGDSFAGVELVFLVELHLTKAVLSLSDDYVAGGAGTKTSTGMLKIDFVVETGLEDGCSLFDLDGLVEWDEGDGMACSHWNLT